MSYNRFSNKKYLDKYLNHPLPKLQEDERIYLNVDYMARQFAQICNCGFDPKRKLWFTGCKNASLYALVRLYGVNEATSQRAIALMNEALSSHQDETEDNEAQ